MGSGRTGWCLEQLLALLPAGSGSHHLGSHLLPPPVSQADGPTASEGNKKGSSMFLKWGLPPGFCSSQSLGRRRIQSALPGDRENTKGTRSLVPLAAALWARHISDFCTVTSAWPRARWCRHGALSRALPARLDASRSSLPRAHLGRALAGAPSQL